MRSCGIIAVALLLAVGHGRTFGWQQNSSNSVDSEMEALCGVHAAYIALALANAPVDYKELRGRFPAIITNKGVSMRKIEQALEHFDRPRLAVKINYGYFCTIKGALGIFRQPGRHGETGHFFVASSFGDGRVEILDPPFDPYILTTDDLIKDAWLPAILLTRAGDFSEYAGLFSQ